MRYELSDYERTAIKPMLPNKPRGVRRANDRRVLDGIVWVLRSGAPWRDLRGAVPWRSLQQQALRVA
jgi:transposase